MTNSYDEYDRPVCPVCVKVILRQERAPRPSGYLVHLECVDTAVEDELLELEAELAPVLMGAGAS